MPNERTKLVAEAIERWLRQRYHGNVGSTLFVKDGAEWESDGHIVSWEEGPDDWPFDLSGGGVISRNAAWMQTRVEVKNHYELVVLEELDKSAEMSDIDKTGWQ